MRILINLIATAIGLWLSYAAVLNFSSLESAAWTTYLAAAVVIALGAYARTQDFAAWPGTSSALAGLALAAGFAMHQAGLIDRLASFWVIFFAGNVISVVSLWAALYPPGSASSNGALDAAEHP